MSEINSFPYPIPDYGSEPYWEACNDERLIMQQCQACNKFRWTPAPLCTHCGDDAYIWSPLSGRGKITTWTVVTHAVHPAAVSRVPYIVVEVELEEQEGLRMLSNLVDVEPDEVDFGLAVVVGFDAHPQGQKLPVFRRA